MSKVFDPKLKDKLDNPMRRKEIPPMETLKRFGLKADDIVVDIGCGTGYFTMPALEIVDGAVYAIDLSQEMLDEVKKKSTSERLNLIKSDESGLILEDESSTFAILSMVLHEVEDGKAFLAEIGRILKSGGKLAIIEWQKAAMPMGPSLDHRISSDDIVSLSGEIFQLTDQVKINDMFYGCILTKY